MTKTITLIIIALVHIAVAVWFANKIVETKHTTANMLTVLAIVFASVGGLLWFGALIHLVNVV